MRAACGILAIAIAIAIVAGACAPSSPSSSPNPVASATGAVSPTAGTAASPVDGSPAGPSETASGPAVVLDESLLGYLPPDIGGVAVRLEPDAAAEAASDPDFARNVEAAAFAVVVDANDLASGVVARLRPGVFDEALFRDWRDTYNDGACGQAGGVAGNAQAEIGGRTVYIATCAGGLHVYHAYLPERGVIVSLFSLGDRRFGEQLMSGLRP